MRAGPQSIPRPWKRVRVPVLGQPMPLEPERAAPVQAESALAEVGKRQQGLQQQQAPAVQSGEPVA